jgi:hypothetical protein
MEALMQFDKSQIIDMLESAGDHDKASQAASELPGTVDTDRDSGLLSKLGLDPQDLISKLAGGGDLGGLGKMLG